MRNTIAVRSSTWQDIRALRAIPTGTAASDGDRRETFVASLRQAEELAQAAAAAGYTARPLPMFYALSQAGRAIAAAHLTGTWVLRGHGLSTRRTDQKTLLDTIVAPSGAGVNSFQGVASVIKSPTLLGGAQLGALWAANPDLLNVPIPCHLSVWPRALEIGIGVQALDPATTPADPRQHHITTGGLFSASVKVAGATGGEVAAALAPYPSLQGAFGIKQGPLGAEPAGPTDSVIVSADHQGVTRAGIGKMAPAQMNMSDWWRGQRELASFIEIDQTQPRHPHPHLVGFALPEVGGGQSPFPLMLWWALLFGLSSLARYEPAAWTAAIDLDSSDLAVSLERVLDIAAEQVPSRIYAALTDPTKIAS